MRLVDKDAASRVLKQLGHHNEEITLTVKETKEGPRWVHSNRKDVQLCGGNGVGILIERRLGELKVNYRFFALISSNILSLKSSFMASAWCRFNAYSHVFLMFA